MTMLVAVAWLAAAGQQANDSEAVLQRTRERLRADLVLLPRYTCVQTITRRYFRAPSSRQHSCSDLIQAHDLRTRELNTSGWDRLRLEVAILDGTNVYSWVGASRFEENNIEELAGRGPLGSGDFGSFLDAIFRYGIITFLKEDVSRGRRLLEYAYDMPQGRSGYLIRGSSGWVATAYGGTLLLDPEEADVVRMTVRTSELPQSNPDCQANTEIGYQRTPIHGRLVLIPQETRLNAIDRAGGESLSVTSYESCREYASKSRVLAFAPVETAVGAAPASAAVSPLSPDLHFQCRIVTPIDSDTAAAGDPVEALLRSPIHDRKNHLSISAGARLHGRLIRMERRSGLFSSFRVAIQWQSITVEAREVPLHAAPEILNQYGSVTVGWDDDSPDARFFVFREDHLRLRQLDWSWTTQPVDDAGKTGPANDRSAPRLNTIEITDSEFHVEAGGGVDFKLSVPAGATSVRLEGTFKANGALEVFIFSSDAFPKWQNEEPVKALYESDLLTQGTLDVLLPAGAGDYYLVFSNNLPLSSPAVVQASIRLHYVRHETAKAFSSGYCGGGSTRQRGRGQSRTDCGT